MRVAVVGLWHLGCVTAACLARAGHDVVGFDVDPTVIEGLSKGRPPIFEPGLGELIHDGLEAKRLRFEKDMRLCSGAEIIWVTFDTPVDEDDNPKPDIVIDCVLSLIENAAPNCLILISSQVPVGTTSRLYQEAVRRGRADVKFAYSPENLRLGRAIAVFTEPDRVVVGVQSSEDRLKIERLFGPITNKIVWMGVEAAEMTKHAINAFLATSVAFMNEIATVCEQVGANANEVERGLKTEARIGPRAYLSPGGAFAGGTLARDIATLADLNSSLGLDGVLIAAVRESNNRHQAWPLHRLRDRFKPLAGRRVAILGLTYKPGTSTLRRSSAVELAKQLTAEGVEVIAFDPAVAELPEELINRIQLAKCAADALGRADAVVIATAWPEFHELPWPDLLASMNDRTVVDANGFLAPQLREAPSIAYTAVGLPWTYS